MITHSLRRSPRGMGYDRVDCTHVPFDPIFASRRARLHRSSNINIFLNLGRRNVGVTELFPRRVFFASSVNWQPCLYLSCTVHLFHCKRLIIKFFRSPWNSLTNDPPFRMNSNSLRRLRCLRISSAYKNNTTFLFCFFILSWPKNWNKNRKMNVKLYILKAPTSRSVHSSPCKFRDAYWAESTICQLRSTVLKRLNIFAVHSNNNVYYYWISSIPPSKRIVGLQVPDRGKERKRDPSPHPMTWHNSTSNNYCGV